MSARDDLRESVAKYGLTLVTAYAVSTVLYLAITLSAASCSPVPSML